MTALVCLKLSNQEIAERLVVSVETVRTHMRSVLQKLDLHSKAELRLMYVDWDFSRWLEDLPVEGFLMSRGFLGELFSAKSGK